jgi:hypothetical protein
MLVVNSALPRIRECGILAAERFREISFAAIHKTQQVRVCAPTVYPFAQLQKRVKCHFVLAFRKYCTDSCALASQFDDNHLL